MKVGVVVNRGGGTAATSGRELKGEIRAAFQDAGVEAAVSLVDGKLVADAARAALDAGVDAVVAGGGDGTIRAVAGVLSGTGSPMGVLPLGTRNHFARDLGIPLDLEEAARVVAARRPQALDLGEVNGEVFVNNSLLGFYPPVVKVRDQERRRLGRSKNLATVSALLKVLPKLPALHVHVDADGERIERKTRFVFVGNNEYAMNAFNFGARSRFDSGDLYLYIADCPGRLCLLGLALFALVRDVKRAQRFESWCVPALTIDLAKKVEPVYLDGEVILLEPPLVYRTRERALSVLVPPEVGREGGKGEGA